MSSSVMKDGGAESPDTGPNYLCDKCDREARHVIRQLAPDGSVRYVCWSCLGQEERRFNRRDSWRRDARAGRG